ncbi:MAG TPA: tetraacyldisaccharide 4'-kinase [Terracidiphilus sp.]|jgi:tetraacyldisaccharide 4'-kinase|nr:tetraacyldisaccharide 4'-kinase [Terracidiphilus sp.]
MNVRTLLLPLTPLYRLALALRERRLATGREPARRLRHPVFSIGNLSTGGTGKTPFTIALAQALTARGFSVDVLSRGYGRSSRAAARVRPEGTAEEFGDEPLLIARRAGVPVYVAPERHDAGVLAEQASQSASISDFQAQSSQGLKPESLLSSLCGATEVAPLRALPVRSPFSGASSAPEGSPAIHILDDGFQHRQLHRDIDIVLLNRADWHDRLLPAGNLREPLASIRRAHILAIPATEPGLEAELRAWGWTGPLWFLHRRMEIPPIDGPVLAFCGIARPDQFFEGLQSAGVPLAARRAFPDHHRYTSHDLDRLTSRARAAGAVALLTTEKDAIRLAPLQSSLPVLIATLRTEIEDQPAALDWLIGRLPR